jgi:hypothetical protein
VLCIMDITPPVVKRCFRTIFTARGMIGSQSLSVHTRHRLRAFTKASQAHPSNVQALTRTDIADACGRLFAQTKSAEW